jgi:hypothetical protein
MTAHDRRKELLARYKQSGPEAGVYCIRNNATGKTLLGSALNLASVRNKLAFAKSTRTASALDWRLLDDVRQFGLEALSMEVLEVLQPEPGTAKGDIVNDLATLEVLWREKFDPALLY